VMDHSVQGIDVPCLAYAGGCRLRQLKSDRATVELARENIEGGSQKEAVAVLDAHRS